jgi:type II secretory ATPase GspE/PulE/Tfp pilus assembly ATPase PilB-like protein
LHAGSACGVVSRLLDMEVEPYLLTSGLKGILNQRLVRRLCPACRPLSAEGLAGCDQCGGTGYRGRLLLAELLTLDTPLRQAILARSDTSALEAAAHQPGRATIRMAAEQAIAAGLTTREEIERVLGPG